MDVLYASPRLEFSLWDQQDPQLAHTLWGNPQVTHFLTTDGIMTPEQVDERLKKEIEQYQRCGHQYHPVFLREGGAFIGVCGLRPYGMGADIFELGVHLLPDYWHAGYAQEAARRTIDRAFSQLGCQAVFAGHHPKTPLPGHCSFVWGSCMTTTNSIPPPACITPPTSCGVRPIRGNNS